MSRQPSRIASLMCAGGGHFFLYSAAAFSRRADKSADSLLLPGIAAAVLPLSSRRVGLAPRCSNSALSTKSMPMRSRINGTAIS